MKERLRKAALRLTERHEAVMREALIRNGQV